LPERPVIGDHDREMAALKVRLDERAGK
jgi:hypothetical protein